MHNDGHKMNKDNPGDTKPAAHTDHVDPEHPGYELEDVNTGGVVVFLSGLVGFLIIFFFVCYGMGRVINNLWAKMDGPATKWTTAAGMVPAGKGKDLESNPDIRQQQLQQITANFPEPRLDVDDGNQATADLHAREDLLLEHTSTVDGMPGTIRIPIERAMELIAQRGLPVESTAAGPSDSVAYAGKPEIQAPLTTGFARTGYELTVMEAREQKINYGKAVAQAEK
jgi:hypothetical protein